MCKEKLFDGDFHVTLSCACGLVQQINTFIFVSLSNSIHELLINQVDLCILQEHHCTDEDPGKTEMRNCTRALLRSCACDPDRHF